MKGKATAEVPNETVSRGRWRHRLRPGLAHVLRAQPLQPAGLVLLAGAALVCWWFGKHQRDLILLMASAILLIIAVLDILLVVGTAWATRRWWARQLDTMPDSLPPLLAGVPARLPLNGRLPWFPLVEVTSRWIDPADVQTEVRRAEDGQFYEEFTFRGRCQIARVTREFTISDVLGFAQVRFRRERALQLEVWPRPQPLDRSTFVTSFHGGDEQADVRGDLVGDRVDMRQYAAGDPPKLLLWKLYARTGKLMVRMPERAVMPTPRTCAYLVAGPQDEAVAGLMRSVLESNLLGAGWRFGADGNTGHCSSAAEALTFLARSGNLARSGQTRVGLAAFLAQAARDGFNGCLVALPSGKGEWLELARAAARVTPLQISWAAAPGFIPPPSASQPLPAWVDRLKPWLLWTPPSEAAGEPEKILETLAGVGRERWLYHPASHSFVRFGGKAVV